MAFDIDLFNELSADPSARRDPTSRLLHQLDEDGEIIRSFGSVSYPRDVGGLHRMADRLNRTRLVFSPVGKAYFYHQNEPILEQVSLSDGSRLGSIPLPHSWLAAKILIETVQFVGETEVFYAVALADEGGLLIDSQIRMFDFEDGNSRSLGSFDPQATGVTATRMDFARGIGRTFGFSKGNLKVVRETGPGDIRVK